VIRVGTSGWSYPHWRGLFYPENLPSGKWLEYYAEHFDTVELNNTFYHLPRPATFANWHQRTPENFLFSVKGSRFISHILKLNGARESCLPAGRPLQNLLKNARELKEKLGPVLFQLPPNFSGDRERLEKFLKILPKGQRFAFEFRHPSWFGAEVYHLLEKSGSALVISDTPQYPLVFEVTADFVYVRLHGHQQLYASKYSSDELKQWAAKIKNWQKDGLDVFVYFDNDANAHAIQNAKELKTLVNSLTI